MRERKGEGIRGGGGAHPSEGEAGRERQGGRGQGGAPATRHAPVGEEDVGEDAVAHHADLCRRHWPARRCLEVLKHLG